jgi:hypothetical protein
MGSKNGLNVYVETNRLHTVLKKNNVKSICAESRRNHDNIKYLQFPQLDENKYHNFLKGPSGNKLISIWPVDLGIILQCDDDFKIPC